MGLKQHIPNKNLVSFYGAPKTGGFWVSNFGPSSSDSQPYLRWTVWNNISKFRVWWHGLIWVVIQMLTLYYIIVYYSWYHDMLRLLRRLYIHGYKCAKPLQGFALPDSPSRISCFTVEDSFLICRSQFSSTPLCMTTSSMALTLTKMYPKNTSRSVKKCATRSMTCLANG